VNSARWTIFAVCANSVWVSGAHQQNQCRSTVNFLKIRLLKWGYVRVVLPRTASWLAVRSFTIISVRRFEMDDSSCNKSGFATVHSSTVQRRVGTASRSVISNSVGLPPKEPGGRSRLLRCALKKCKRATRKMLVSGKIVAARSDVSRQPYVRFSSSPSKWTSFKRVVTWHAIPTILLRCFHNCRAYFLLTWRGQLPMVGKRSFWFLLKLTLCSVWMLILYGCQFPI